MKRTKVCTFYVIRHGQTHQNLTDIYGDIDSDLTNTGIRQVYALKEKLRGIHFDSIHSSDMIRAVQTAGILKKDRDTPHLQSENLRERFFGSESGNTISDVRTKYKELFDSFDTKPEEELFAYRLTPDQETNEEAVARFMSYLLETAKTNPDKSILIVSHGSIMRNFLVKLGFASIRDLRADSLPNTCIIIVTSDGSSFKLLKTIDIPVGK